MGPKASFHINLNKGRFGAAIVTVKLSNTSNISNEKKKETEQFVYGNFVIACKQAHLCELGEVLVAELAAQAGEKNG